MRNFEDIVFMYMKQTHKHMGRFSNLHYCTFKFDTKNTLLAIFRLKIGKKAVVIFGVSTLKFAEMQKNYAKQKTSNVDPNCLI